MSGNKSEVHEEKTRWSLSKNNSQRPPTPTSARRNTSIPTRTPSQRELGEGNSERDEEKKGPRLGGSLLAKFAKARLKSKGRSDSSVSASDRDRADTTPLKEFAGLRKSARQRKSTEFRDSEISPSDVGERRASVTYRASRERKSSWRFSLPEQLHNRIGEDKRVFPAHSWSTMSSADPHDLFTLGRKLGESPHAAVFKATVRETGFVVATKIIPVRTQGDVVVSVPQVANEISLLQRARHPNVVRYYGTFYNDDFMWVITEYCAMSSISSIQKYGIHFSEIQLAAVVTSMLHGLAYLHTMGIIHRNLKCSNILMNELGDAKLADFGVPWHWLRSLDKAKGVNPSTYYVAPEVLAGEAWQQEADIWSLGIAVIEMADGQPPYEIDDSSRSAYLLANRPPPTVQDPSKYSPAFIDFISQCLQKDPNKRPSARELLKHDFVNGLDSRNSEEVITKLLQQYQRCKSKKAALVSESRKLELGTKQDANSEEEGWKDRHAMRQHGKRMSRETLASIVHYVRNELNLGNAKDREKQDEETTDYTLTEGEGETTYTGTNTGDSLDQGLDDDDSSILSSDSSLSDSSSTTSSPMSTSMTMATSSSQRVSSERLTTSENAHMPFSYSTSAPAPFPSIRTTRDFEDQFKEDYKRSGSSFDEPPPEEERPAPINSARGRLLVPISSSGQLSSRSVPTKPLPLDEIHSMTSNAPPPPLTPSSAKKEVSFATEKRDSDTDKKKENEKLINGMNPTGRPFRQGSKLGDVFGGDRGQEDDEDDVDEVEHYLNLSVIHIIKELLSWKSRCQHLEMEMAQLILEKQKQSQLIQQSQQLLQYSLSSQLPPTPISSMHGSPLNPPMINRQSYYSSSVPSSPPSNASPTLTRSALRAQKEYDKRRRSTSSMQNIW